MTVYLFAVIIYNQMTRVHADAKLGGGSYVSAMLAAKSYRHIPWLSHFFEYLGRLGQGSLLADFPVTQSISLISGIEALYWIPDEFRLTSAILLLGLLSLVQRFGLHRIGRFLIWPVVTFYATNLAINAFGVAQIAYHGWTRPIMHLSENTIEGMVPLTFHAIANGATLITGVEVGYSSVNVPHSGHRAVRVSMWILYALVLVTYGMQLVNFLGLGVTYDGSLPVPILIAKTLGGKYLAIPFGILTAVMLVLAAQTAQSDFPLGLLRMARADLLPRGLGDASWRSVKTILSERFRTHGGVYNPRGVVLLGILSITVLVLFPTSHLMEGMYGLAVLMAMSITVIGFLLRLLRVHRFPIFVFLGSLIFVAMMLNILWNKFFEGAWVIVVFLAVYMLIFALSRSVYRLYRKRQNIISFDEVLSYPAFNRLPVNETQALLVNSFHPGVMRFLKTFIKSGTMPLVLHFHTEESTDHPIFSAPWFRNIQVPLNRDIISTIVEFVHENRFQRIHLVPVLVSGKFPFTNYFFGNAITQLSLSLSEVTDLQVEYNKERVNIRTLEIIKDAFSSDAK